MRPSVVLHCAAYTDVDAAEGLVAEAMAVNVQGTAHVARAAARLEARMLYLSTDYVFGGTAGRPYREDDETAPASNYARTKLEGERLVGQICPHHIIIRTGWLYGFGKGFVDWLLGRLAGAGPIDIVDDQWGSPTWARHLAHSMIRAAELELQGLYHVVNRGTANWYELGRLVARAMGGATAERRLRPISRQSLSRSAERPRFSPLDVSRFERASGLTLAGWEEAVDGYLRQRPR